jgi:hypothetical protein
VRLIPPGAHQHGNERQPFMYRLRSGHHSRRLEYEHRDVALFMDRTSILISLAIFEVDRLSTDGAPRKPRKLFVGHDASWERTVPTLVLHENKV